MPGSPPRMRGKASRGGLILKDDGITPAYAGKSIQTFQFVQYHRDHPRVCGEKHFRRAAGVFWAGSPPRMRGKAGSSPASGTFDRITPAYAGKSNRDQTILTTFEDHPRVCGEKDGRLDFSMLQKGSPPRVRGKAALWRVSRPLFRITPACAGKSAKAERTSRCSWDHPRVCGEKDLVSRQLHFSTGSPPRVRGKEDLVILNGRSDGITPACAGKSVLLQSGSVVNGDHPRVCGEKGGGGDASRDELGSPPRVRGKVERLTNEKHLPGITPACAGKSSSVRTTSAVRWDHPRVCGEKLMLCHRLRPGRGSPPRVRGKGLCFYTLWDLLGITPACAGKRSLGW